MTFRQCETGFRQVVTTFRQRETGFRQKETTFRQEEMSFRQKEKCFRQRETGFRRKEMTFRRKEIGFRRKETGFRQREMGFRQKVLGLRQMTKPCNRRFFLSDELINCLPDSIFAMREGDKIKFLYKEEEFQYVADIFGLGYGKILVSETPFDRTFEGFYGPYARNALLCADEPCFERRRMLCRTAQQ